MPGTSWCTYVPDPVKMIKIQCRDMAFDFTDPRLPKGTAGDGKREYLSDMAKGRRSPGSLPGCPMGKQASE